MTPWQKLYGLFSDKFMENNFPAGKDDLGFQASVGVLVLKHSFGENVSDILKTIEKEDAQARLYRFFTNGVNLCEDKQTN